MSNHTKGISYVVASKVGSGSLCRLANGMVGVGLFCHTTPTIIRRDEKDGGILFEAYHSIKDKHLRHYKNRIYRSEQESSTVEGHKAGCQSQLFYFLAIISLCFSFFIKEEENIGIYFKQLL